MLSVNDCLYPSEIESILKLTAKDIEPLSINNFYAGQNLLGAGKLEIGDAVSFTNEMKKIDGNAIIANHVFNRFEFNLSKINNKLTIQEVVFKENCKANFKSRNIIDITSNSDFYPNTTGFIDLKTDPIIDINCAPVVFNYRAIKPKVNEITASTSHTSLYPVPNNGVFTINLGDIPKFDIEVNIYDVTGRLIYKTVKNENIIKISLPNISSGIYFVKLLGDNYNETVKFIKN